jgi:hypothetical protein
VLAACQTLQAPDVPATLQAQDAAYGTAVIALQRTADANRTQVNNTALSAATQVAAIHSVNVQLLATVEAGNPPTSAVVPGIAPETSNAVPQNSDAVIAGGIGGMAFVETGTTASKRESDGCKAYDQTEFAASTPRIYVITRALHLAAGTLMAVEWLSEGQPVAQGSWTSPSDEQNFCVWFYITPDEVALHLVNGRSNLS